MRESYRVWVVLVLCTLGFAGCASSARTLPSARAAGTTMTMPNELPASVSPAKVPALPMARTPVQSAAAMNGRRPQSDISMLGWTQLPGGAVFVAASPDHSLWALSTLGNGTDYYIYHYVNKTWTPIPGAAVRLAVGLDGNPWAVTANGGIYHYNGSSWVTVAGGASDITVASDNTVYVISNAPGGPYGRGIWHYVNNSTWTQVPGAGIRIAASLDAAAYSGGIQPGGFYVINANQYIFYYDPTVQGFHAVNGGAFQLAPTRSGGIFALGIPQGQYGYPIYYNDLNSSTWTQQPGAGTSITTDGVTVYVTGVDGGIYSAPVNAHNIVGNGTPLTGPDYTPGTTGAWGPTIFANTFQYPVQSGFDGTGYSVAIVIDSGYLGSDLSSYLSYFQTPSTSRQITYKPVDGADSSVTGDQGEATLDVETVAGLAPGANVLVYVIPSLDDQSIIDAYNQILTDGQARVVSSSFGGCEYSGSSEQSSMGLLFQQGASSGVSFVASSGDQGNDCYAGQNANSEPIYQVGVSYPASDPNVIGVGGTETHRPQYALNNAAVWNDTYSSVGQLASGGGVSASFTLPSYQSGLAGVASTQYRNVPDVALPASYDGIYYKGGWHAAAGTSWSAPAFAALQAEVDQYCQTVFSSPVSVPYYVYAVAGNGAFLDVTSGNNQFHSDTPYYSAGAGYDNATGLGAPLGMPYAQAICPNRVAAARARAPMARSALAQRGPSYAVPVDVVPKLRGVLDRGARATNATTRVQLVLRPTPSVASDEQTVSEVLRSAGFTVTKTFANHLVVDTEAPSARVEALFSTQLHDVAQPGAGTRYMPVAAAAIPASLAPYVAGLSLNNLVTRHHAGGATAVPR